MIRIWWFIVISLGSVGDLRMKHLEITFGLSFKVLREILSNWTSYQIMIHKLKFALYIVFLVVIFLILWSRMIVNMRRDIIKALGILNVLPTSHLGANLYFIKEMNHSSLIN